MNKTECVVVAVRCRPMSSREIEEGQKRVVEMDLSLKQILISNPDPRDMHESAPRSFTFDMIFDWNTQQVVVFDTCALPIVNSVLEGQNGTIFAQGQTGTGKTHTMEGKSDKKELNGIIPRSFVHIFEQIDYLSHKQFLVRVQMLEIYNEKIRDLLSQNPNNNLELKENDSGVYVKDQSDFVVNSPEQMHNLLEHGKGNRKVGCTEMNKDSSRSHCVFTIVIEASESKGEEQAITRGKLNLVDLAGSERQSKTHAQGERLQEAKSINLSLTCLGNVISALVDGKSQHIPYRNSKLTRILQDSLGGNTKTIMIANIGPVDYNQDETISTLRQANRAKNIKNKPKINEDPKDAMLREFQDEISKLKAQLAMMGGEGFDPTLLANLGGGSGAVNPQVVQKENEERVKEIERKMEEEKNEIKRNAEHERRLIESQKNMAEEERAKLMEKIRQKEEEQAKVQEEKIDMYKKLKTMESKVVKGTKAMEKAEQQEKIIKQTYEELNKQREREAKLKQELDEKENQQMMLEKKYKSQDEEIKDKTSKLKKLWGKYSQVNQELYDLKEDYSREREDAQFNIRELNMELKLKNLILEQFIPQEEWLSIEKRAVWNEEMDNWMLPKLELAGNVLKKQRPASALGFNRPTSTYSKAQKENGSADPRHYSENILHMELDMPDRNTLDYTGQVHGHLNGHIHEDLTKVKEFRTQDNSIFNEKKNVKPAVKRPATAKNKGNLNNPNDDIIDKVEKKEVIMKSFPLKK